MYADPPSFSISPRRAKRRAVLPDPVGPRMIESWKGGNEALRLLRVKRSFGSPCAITGLGSCDDFRLKMRATRSLREGFSSVSACSLLGHLNEASRKPIIGLCR